MNKNNVIQFNYLKYEQKYKDFYDGKITTEEWVDFCLEILEDLMWINQSILLRLKKGE